MQNNLGDLLEKEIYPTLWDHLDTAFPEFGFRRKGGHWVATDESASRMLPGAPRPNRVWVYDDSPYGIKIHGGEFVTWMAHVSGQSPPYGIDFINAVKELCRRAGVVFPEMKRAAPRVIKEKNIETFHEEMCRWGREQLLSEPGKPILDYLISRGLSREEIEKKTDLCAIPHRKHFQDEFINHKGYKIEHLKESGLLAWGFGINYQLFFPVRDDHGKIVSWGSRLTVPGKDKDGDNLDKYKNAFGLHKDLPYNFSRAKKAIERSKQVIIVEGFMDAVHCFAKGFENVVAILGARLLPNQLNHLILAGATQILMCLDRDKDGEEGSELAFKLFGLFPKLHPYFVFLPPSCKDADETLKKFTKADFEEMLNLAQPGWQWYAQCLVGQYNNSTDRDDHLKRFGMIYNQIIDPVMKDDFIRPLSKGIKIGIRTLLKTFQVDKVDKFTVEKLSVLSQFSQFLDKLELTVNGAKSLYEIIRFFDKQKGLSKTISGRNPVGKVFKEFIEEVKILAGQNNLSTLNKRVFDMKMWIEKENGNNNVIKKVI